MAAAARPRTPAPEPPRKSWFALRKVLTGLLALVLTGIIATVTNGGGGSTSTATSPRGAAE